MQTNFKSLLQLNDYFKEEKTCYEFLADQVWEDGKPVCPHCGSITVYTTKSRSNLAHKKDIPEYRCGEKECAKKFTATVGTIFHASKLPLRTWYAAIFLITTSKKGVSSLQLAEQLQITQKSAWHLLHRIRNMFKETEPTMLKTVVQIDESFVGGKNKNRHADKKIPNAQGRSCKDKTPVLDARGLDGKVKLEVIPNTEAETLKPLIEKWVEKGSIMVTDNWKGYSGLQDYFHVVINHTEGEYTRGCFSSNGIENFWSIFKRGIIGIYHQVSAKHLHRYTTEFGYRYNHRENSGVERFKLAVSKSGQKRLSYRTLINKDANSNAQQNTPRS